MDNKTIGTKNLKNPIAHANFRNDLDDYSDGGPNTTHYLGNESYYRYHSDDYDDEKYNVKLEGKVADGNELTDDGEDET